MWFITLREARSGCFGWAGLLRGCCFCFGSLGWGWRVLFALGFGLIWDRDFLLVGFLKPSRGIESPRTGLACLLEQLMRDSFDLSLFCLVCFFVAVLFVVLSLSLLSRDESWMRDIVETPVWDGGRDLPCLILSHPLIRLTKFRYMASRSVPRSSLLSSRTAEVSAGGV